MTEEQHQAREAVIHAAAIRAALCASRGLPPSSGCQVCMPLPEDLVRATLQRLRADRRQLEGFLALGNEVERATRNERWIVALELYVGQHYKADGQDGVHAQG